MRHRVALALGAFSLLAVPVSAVAFARAEPKIDPTARLLDGGRKLRIAGPLSQPGGCVSGETAAIRVTVTQRAVLARGRWRGRCKSSTRGARWSTTVRVAEGSHLQEGTAKACALGTFRGRDGQVQFFKQWCRVIRLR